MADSVGTAPRSGFVTFAGVLAIFIGFFNAIGGIAAIGKDDTIQGAIQSRNAEVLFGIDYNAWGWFWLILGVVQIIVGGLILSRSSVGLILGIVWATLSATLTIFVIFVYPFWALAVIGINVLIIWGLLNNAEEFS